MQKPATLLRYKTLKSIFKTLNPCTIYAAANTSFLVSCASNF